MRTMVGYLLAVTTGLVLFSPAPSGAAPYLMEDLGRGVVAIRTNATDVYVGWRMLGTDPPDVAFNLYRSGGGGAPVVLNATPIVDVTNFVDTTADLGQSNAYHVRAIIGGVEGEASGAFTLPAGAPANQYLSIALVPPPSGVTPRGAAYSYTANDASVGDLDGDGEYEIVLKWDPTNAQDNANDGYTGNVFLDAYKLDGTRLWRIDLGRNIRAGAHYTQFMVYDLDGDGKAELAMKTADGTVDGVGTVIGDAAADYRNAAGRILDGPEFLTIFNGQTGAALATTDYIPARGNVADWGDNYGNRVDRFLAAVAYLDGQRPSLVMCRGYYTRAVLVAWNWRDGALTHVWTFDSDDGTPGNLAYRGQGNHNLSVGDVDGDGKQEIVYGAAVIDDNGKGLYSTGWSHGDALHLSDMDPDRPGLEVFQPHETPSVAGAEFRDARTGELIWGVQTPADNGRGMADDIDPTRRGFEMWTGQGVGLRDRYGNQISGSTPPINFAVWWDADLTREMLDEDVNRGLPPTLSKWDWTTNASVSLLVMPGLKTNNGTKATPSLSGDILGDWREEFILRTLDNSELRIYTTTIPAANRMPTLMHDPQYRVSIAWQNVAYNQPPHPSFYLGDGMNLPPTPDIVTDPEQLTERPTTPIVTGITTDAGVSATDRITNDTTLLLNGTGGGGDTVTVSKLGAGVLGTAIVDGGGNWTFDYSATALPAGSHYFTATATNGLGQTSGAMPPFQVLVDTAAPAVVSVSRLNPVGDQTSANTVTFRVAFSERVAGLTTGGFALSNTGALTGIISAVSAGQGNFVDVTVSSIVGLGTMRLDVKDATSGIIDIAGNPLSGGLTSGQTYTFVSPTWIQPISGGLWSDPANWSGGVIGEGLGLTASFNALDLSGDNVVHLDAPHTIGNLVFGDSVTATPGSWIIDGDNVLTLAVPSGNPTITVNPMGTGSTTTISAGVATAAGFTKAGAGVLALAGPTAIPGTTTVSAGVLRVAPGGMFTPAAVNVGPAGAQLSIAGGSFTATGNVRITPGSGAGVYVDSGTAAFNTIDSTNSGGSVVRISGGTITANGISFPRSADATASYGTGLIVTGGALTVGTIGLGTNNSHASMSVEGGSVLAPGPVNVGALSAASGRGGHLRVTGGTFTSTDATTGFVVTRGPGNVSDANFLGGVSTLEKVTLGYNSSVVAGSATLNVNGGALYIGSGGIVKNGASAFTASVNLTSGVLGAKASWVSALDMNLPAANSIIIKAADASETPRDVSLSGALVGAGGFTKAGAGELLLAGTSTYSGNTAVDAGTLRVDGTLAAAAGSVAIGSGAALAGKGSVDRTVILNGGGAIAPGSVAEAAALRAGTLAWNGGGALRLDLGAVSDSLVLNGALTKGVAGTYTVILDAAQPLPLGVYTLATFSSSDFVVGDFSLFVPPDHAGFLTLTANSLECTITKHDSEPPVLTLPDNLTVEATDASGAVVAFAATAHDAVDGDVAVSYSHAPGTVFPLGVTTVTVSATDLSGNTATGSFTVTVRDTTPPMLTLPADMTIEATSPAGAVATFAATATDAVDPAVVISYNPAPGTTFTIGLTTVTVTATDASGNTASGTFSVTVRDTTAPVFVRLSAEPHTLWPPNHEMVRVRVHARLSDAADPRPHARIVSVTSNEPTNAESPLCNAPGRRPRHLSHWCSEEDFRITGDLTLKLRAERDERGSGRVYTITVESVDTAGNTATQATTVTVPKTRPPHGHGRHRD